MTSAPGALTWSRARAGRTGTGIAARALVGPLHLDQGRDAAPLDDLADEDDFETAAGKLPAVEKHLRLELADDDTVGLPLGEIALIGVIGGEARESRLLGRFAAEVRRRSAGHPRDEDHRGGDPAQSGPLPGDAEGRSDSSEGRATRSAAIVASRASATSRSLSRFALGEQFPGARFGRRHQAELRPFLGRLDAVEDAADEDVGAMFAHGSRSRREGRLRGTGGAGSSGPLFQQVRVRRRDVFAEHASSADDPVLDGRLGQVQHVRDLGIAQVMHKAKEKRFGVSRRQGREPFAQPFAGISFDARGRPSHAARRLVAPNRSMAACRRRVPRPDMRAAFSATLRSQPGKRLRVPQRVHLGDQGRGHFLEEVLDIDAARPVQEEDRGDPAAMALPQPVKGSAVAGLGGGEECVVVGVGHGRKGREEDAASGRTSQSERGNGESKGRARGPPRRRSE